MEKIQKLTSQFPVLTNNSFQNPVEITRPEENNEIYPLTLPDPFILKYNGLYYCYATGEKGISILKSKDLVHWKHLGLCLQNENQKNYWAPAVYYKDGIFYLYYSSQLRTQIDPHYEYLKVAISKTPEGPFEYQKTLFDYFSIDPHVIRDSDGKYYLFYSTNNYAGMDFYHPGTVILVDELIDMYSPSGNPKIVVEPTLEEEVFEENRFGDGRDWHTIEGAYYLQRKNKRYVMYSGNAYVKPHYFIGYSVSKYNENIPLNACKWKKHPNNYTYEPLMRRNDVVIGTGHNSVMSAPNLIDDWIIYHGVDKKFEQDMVNEHRVMRVDPIFWKLDKFWIPGPSYQKQDIPFKPSISDLFDQSLEKWEILDGNWGAINNELKQTTESRVGKILLKKPFSVYKAEVSMKWNPPNPSHLGGLFGIYLSYVDVKNSAQLLFDEGKNEFYISVQLNGINKEIYRRKLEEGFNWAVYHNIGITRTGIHFIISMDDIELCRIKLPFDEGKLGFVTYFTSVSLAGFSLTKYLFLNNKNQIGFLHFIEEKTNQGHWQIENNTINYLINKEYAELLLKNLFSKNYQFSVDIHCNSHIDGNFGVFACYIDQNNYIKIGFNQITKEIQISIVRNGNKDDRVLPFTTTFNFHQGHTLLVRKFHDKIYAAIDDFLILEETFLPEKAKVGIFSNVKSSYEWFEIHELVQ